MCEAHLTTVVCPQCARRVEYWRNWGALCLDRRAATEHCPNKTPVVDHGDISGECEPCSEKKRLRDLRRLQKKEKKGKKPKSRKERATQEREQQSTEPESQLGNRSSAVELKLEQHPDEVHEKKETQECEQKLSEQNGVDDSPDEDPNGDSSHPNGKQNERTDLPKKKKRGRKEKSRKTEKHKKPRKSRKSKI